MSENNERKPRRVLISDKPQIQTGSISDSAATTKLLEDALTVIQIEVSRLRKKVLDGSALQLAEARVLHGHIKSLVELKREQRMADKEDEDGIEDLSDEELEALAIQLAEKRKKKRS